ncbi:MAG: type II toxin-antitoxin system VapC family toxin [Nitrososphaerota archaeon]|nr:type II toxin-antitoxin system VapC family toxin [Candidatus Bathyarchaeota archaeon]MDW8049171.1 type II toxin-antitoxin system VapC family toxin [Nitrososphaerota archaeon]
MRFIDSNVFLYILIGSPQASFETARNILQRIEEGEEAVTSTAIIQEVADWLEYNGRRQELKAFITAVNSYISLQKVTASWEDMISAIDYTDTYGIDYIDALTIQLMKKHNVNEIYSNDKDFDKVEWIKRVWK